jgi:hypothetical protein
MMRLLQGSYADAVTLVRTCLLVARRLGPGVASGELIFAAACCAAWQGEPLRAAWLHGAGDADIAASLKNRSIIWSDAEQSLREREQSRLRDLMGDAAYADAYRAGAQLSVAEATDLALNRDAAN